MRTLPFTKEKLDKITTQFPTPFHIYDEQAIRENAKNFYKAFSWVPGGFTNYFAVKALPNPYIMKILKEEGMGADCSSLPELMLSEKIGLKSEKIMFSSNDTPTEEYEAAFKLNAIINLDDISHIDFLCKNTGVPEKLCFRYNPGPLKKGNAIIGSPEEAKYGFTRPQIIEGFKKAKDLGVKHFGIHTMVASNELNPDYFIETARIMFDLIVEIYNETGIKIEFLNLGGGIGIPYKPEDKPVDLFYVSKGIKALYDEKIKPTELNPLKIVMECGRIVTGPYGYLVSRIRHLKETYKSYAGLDSCMADLMRPGVYGAYHHITIPGKENVQQTKIYDVTGSLCENNDKFAINRELPVLDAGDLVVIHDTGAHGSAMGFNYNGKLRPAELLLKENGETQLIRRAETIEDYFTTLDFSKLND